MAGRGHGPLVGGPSGSPGVDLEQEGRLEGAAPAPEVLIRPREALVEAGPLVPGYVPPLELRRQRRLERGDLEVAGGLQELPRVRDAAEGSFGAMSVLEVVLGVDDRVALGDDLVRTNPWRQICALRITSPSGVAYVGTAWFIAPSVLATAGHCVFLREDGGFAASIEVIPGLAGAMEPYGRVSATRYACVDGWRDTGGRDFDYGVIYLDGSDLGTRVGNFAVETAPDADLVGAVCRISGYPYDRDDATRQYYHERPLLSVTPTRLNYDIDTFGGQSGSPIWLQVAGRGAVAVGIHTTGTATGNSGTRISDAVLDNLFTWIEAAG